MPNNDNIDFTTNPANEDPSWMSLLAVADDDKDDDPGDYNAFCSNYDFNDDGVFDNDDTDQGEGYVFMMVTIPGFPWKKMNTNMMISYCAMVYSMLVVIQAFISINSMALSTIDSVAHTLTTTPFPTHYTMPCSNSR